MKVSIIIPVIRPEKAERCVEAIRALVPDEIGPSWQDTLEIIAVEDGGGIGCPRMVARLTDMAEGELVMFLGDDTIPRPGFLRHALAAMETLQDGWGLVALNDGIHDGRLATHWLASRKLLKRLPGDRFFHTGYNHCFCDRELTDVAREIGRFAYAPEAVIEHDHPHVTGDGYDEGYKKAYRRDSYVADQRLYWLRKQKRLGPRLGVAFPLVDRQVPSNFMLSVLRALAAREYSLYVPSFPGGEFPESLAQARNGLVREALDDGVTHLLMMDTDQIYPPDLLDRLLSHGVDVVSAAVHRRWPPFDLIALRGELGAYSHVPDEELYADQLIEVDATGTGCILFRTEVFTRIEEPWFRTSRINGQPVGEDIFCCSELRSAGVKIHYDTSLEVTHLTTMQVNRSTRELFKRFSRAGAAKA